jgi:hypothetical protein
MNKEFGSSDITMNEEFRQARRMSAGLILRIANNEMLIPVK